jgi:acyl carrier protein
VRELTATNVRRFLLERYTVPIQAIGLARDDSPTISIFFSTGLIDSFGILEMMSAIEAEFDIELDLSALDAEQITVLGPLSRYVAENGSSRAFTSNSGLPPS